MHLRGLEKKRDSMMTFIVHKRVTILLWILSIIPYRISWVMTDCVVLDAFINVKKSCTCAINLVRLINLTLSHPGNYTCEVEWRSGTPKQITHQLQVQVPPQIEAVLPGGMGQLDRPIEAREGSSIKLECRADGIPTPIIRWRRRVSE